MITHPSIFPATDLCHPEEIRPLSTEEYAAIQTFPIDWIFSGSISNIYKQIGNAVPVEFGRIIGENILQFDQNKRRFGSKNIQYPEQLHSRYYKTSHNHFETLLNNNQQNIFE